MTTMMKAKYPVKYHTHIIVNWSKTILGQLCVPGGIKTYKKLPKLIGRHTYSNK